MVLEVLKYILLVLGIVAVGAFIIWGLVSLILIIIEPHENKQGTANNNSGREQQITYEPQKLIAQEPVQTAKQEEPVVTEYVPENEELVDVDEQKAKEEEAALNQGNSFGELSAEEEEFIKEKQRNIEERLAAKQPQEEPEEELDLDNIFIDDEEEAGEVEAETTEAAEEAEETDEDIEALINKILEGQDVEEGEEAAEEPAEVVVEEATEEMVDENEETAENEEVAAEVQEEAVEQTEETTEAVLAEEVVEEEPVEQAEENAEVTEMQQQLKELQEQLARQKEEYETRLKEAEEEKERIITETENKASERTVGALSLEEYEERLETLKERLKNNEKDLKPVKKEYIPLAKIKARLEKDNTKLRRKEALVAKQKVVLYGVNNYVDIDEEKAKKLAEDLDLLEGLRLSVQHCEEVMKANEERYPILESSYNSLMETNTNIKADIEECNKKIAELKAQEANDQE